MRGEIHGVKLSGSSEFQKAEPQRCSEEPLRCSERLAPSSHVRKALPSYIPGNGSCLSQGCKLVAKKSCLCTGPHVREINGVVSQNWVVCYKGRFRDEG